MFPSLITNDTKQIFVKCRKLKDAKKLLIIGKFCILLGIIDLNKINSWEIMKAKVLLINISFREIKEKNSEGHTCFSFPTSALNDLLNFSINLVDDKNWLIPFNNGKSKISILNFPMDVSLR